jgi:gamma-glutamyltranspeptidase
MVATSQPFAVQVGVDVLRAGGHAVDAAIAANIALGLVEPMSCGLGGDLFALVWPAGAGHPIGLNASGRAPHAPDALRASARPGARARCRGRSPGVDGGCTRGSAAFRGASFPPDDRLARSEFPSRR